MSGIKIERLCWQLVNLVEYEVKRRKKNSCRVTISNAHEMTDFEINYLQIGILGGRRNKIEFTFKTICHARKISN